ncbi:hypothetical protein [Jatrophihabitans sp.]|nr:hypothetical protein [Jatrophihabitans sp.]
MSKTASPTTDTSEQVPLPPPPPKQPDDDPPMNPNPYMGGGGTPT